MAEVGNTVESLQPMLKESYASKLQKIVQKPNSSKAYFSLLKKYLKNPKKGS